MRLIVKLARPEAQVRESTHNADVAIGRAADNDVVLNGLTIAQHHLKLQIASGDALTVTSLSPIPVEKNGVAQPPEFTLRVGETLRIGLYELRLQKRESGDDLVLDIVELSSSVHGRQLPRSLKDAGWRMRRPALIGLLLIVVFCLIFPLVFRWIPIPGKVASWLPTEVMWSSGPLGYGHRQLADRCEACHQTMFVRVKDEACLACHQGTKHHSSHIDRLHETGLDTRRCASCHSEHNGPHAALPSSQALCVDCHGDEQRSKNWGLAGAVKDFTSSHPPFAPTVNTLDESTGKWQQARAPAAAVIKDQSGLIFQHDLHLNPNGVKGPNGVQKLDCKGCHVPNVSGSGFEPISFKQTCQSCHALEVNDAKGKIAVPHGDLKSARAVIDAAVASMPAIGATDDDEVRRPGAQADRGSADSRASTQDDLLRRGLCGKCHVFVTDSSPAQLIEPKIKQHWFTQAKFDHAAHKGTACSTCHKATESRDSDVLMLPPIETCRGCHGGANDSVRVPSTCITCHDFHPRDGFDMGRKLDEVAETKKAKP
jgi:predicted CXXCH cytochrome family protein